ncbi:MAG: HYR domain-containing protein, partial [Bacteroidales bacterium]|nr:HYR domain-containing protein [Bacteroidales bacterium]
MRRNRFYTSGSNQANFRKDTYNLYKGIAVITMLAFMASGYSQESTLDNYKGTWSNNLSWVDGTSPGTTGLSVDIDIYGFISCYSGLRIVSGDLVIHDTLVIHGTLDLGNNADLYLDDNAILIVYGDYISGNQVNVGNGGFMVVTGDWDMLGADNQGTFDNNGMLFILDPDPDLKTGDGYGDFTCSNPVDSCQQYGYDELIASEIGAFFLGGSFEINASGPTSFCPGSSVVLSTIDTATNYQWYRDDVAIFGATSFNYTATAAGEYHVDFDITAGSFSLLPVSVTVTDDEPPVINAPGNQTIFSDAGTCTASSVNIGMASVSDNCGIASLTNDAPAVYTPGITTVTWTVTDNAGLTASASHTITVLDNQ